MAFRTPNFNLQVNLWRYTSFVSAIPDVITFGNLSPGKRTLNAPPLLVANTNPPAVGSLLSAYLMMELLLPALTDVRYHADAPGVSHADAVEVPAGSGRFYVCWGADDVGKGFPNEYRLAILAPATATILAICSNPWGIPLPVLFPIP